VFNAGAVPSKPVAGTGSISRFPEVPADIPQAAAHDPIEIVGGQEIQFLGEV
jgi:hypothetical protein